MKLKDKVVFITGAYGVLGTASCIRFAQEGAVVVCTGRNADKLQKLAERIRNSGGIAMPIEMDVTNLDSIRAAVSIVRKAYGRIDCLVNMAGRPSGNGHGDSPFAEKDFDVCKSVVALNLLGPMACSHEVIPLMVENGGGKIINVSSIDGIRGTGNPGKCDYAASKAGLFGLTKSLAKELACYNILVNAVSLGAFADGRLLDNSRQETWEQFKDDIGAVIPRFGEPEEAASLIVFLLSDETNYVTGQNYIMGGGCYM